MKKSRIDGRGDCWGVLSIIYIRRSSCQKLQIREY